MDNNNQREQERLNALNVIRNFLLNERLIAAALLANAIRNDGFEFKYEEIGFPGAEQMLNPQNEEEKEPEWVVVQPQFQALQQQQQVQPQFQVLQQQQQQGGGRGRGGNNQQLPNNIQHRGRGRGRGNMGRGN